MGLQYYSIDKYTYRLEFEHGSNDLCGNTMYIAECSNKSCIYYRGNTDIRERFEKKIFDFSTNKIGIKILFFGSCMLYQEFRILTLLGNKICEVHLTDYAYKNENENGNDKFILAFMQFMQYINTNNLNIEVYVHTDPDRLKDSVLFNSRFDRKFDIICGIDIDYENGCNNGRHIMKEIATNTLNIDGMLLVSQHYTDLVDLSHYKLNHRGELILKLSEDYVKPPYYAKYLFEHNLTKIYYVQLFIGIYFIVNNFSQSSMITIIIFLYIFVSIISRFFNAENIYNQRIINNFKIILKKDKPTNGHYPLSPAR